MKILMWIAGVPIGIFVAVMVLGTLLRACNPEQAQANDARLEQQRKEECSRALMSNIGTSTRSYADKKAYNDHVREKCAGFNIPAQ